MTCGGQAIDNAVLSPSQKSGSNQIPSNVEVWSGLSGTLTKNLIRNGHAAISNSSMHLFLRAV